MTTTFNISLSFTDKFASRDGMHLTGEGFRSERSEPQTFHTEAEARSAFDNIDADYLIRDGFKGYHNVKIYLSKYTVDADDEVNCDIIADKALTVDVEAA